MHSYMYINILQMKYEIWQLRPWTLTGWWHRMNKQFKVLCLAKNILLVAYHHQWAQCPFGSTHIFPMLLRWMGLFPRKNSNTGTTVCVYSCYVTCGKTSSCSDILQACSSCETVSNNSVHTPTHTRRRKYPL